MRALLLFNPNATSTDDRIRDVIAAALASELKLDVEPTKQRGHATHLAAGAIHEGVDVIFVLGGDGTANEVIQAMAGTPVRLGLIPGGSTNVLVRDLGLPDDPIAATAVLLERLREGTETTIGLGRANGRYFATSAGFGFDAAIVRLVERRFRLKRAVRQLSFVWFGLQAFFAAYDRSRLPITVELSGEPHRTGYGLCIAGNANPYAYLGKRPLQVTPDAAFERGLDLLGIRTLRTRRILRVLQQVFTTANHVRARDVDYWRDLDGAVLRSEIPLPYQVDGDYAGETREVLLEAVPEALHVIN
ncbi:MAG: diacylglycerol/lipid kinase family protein [Nitriliruptorales bacterium]